MAVRIRLRRTGRKNAPTFRIVVAESTSPRDGRFIEIIGQYAPREDPSRISIDADSALAWLRKGAQPTEQVQKLLTGTGVWAQYEAERKKPDVMNGSRRARVAKGSGRPISEVNRLLEQFREMQKMMKKVAGGGGPGGGKMRMPPGMFGGLR